MPPANKKQIGTVVFFVSVTIIVLTVYVLFKGQQTIYYSPVLNAPGTSVAYIRRLVDYQVKGGSLIPFMGAQATIRVHSDRLQLCQKDLKTRNVTVLQAWEIDLDKKDKLGSVWVQLDWHGPVLRYHVRLTGYGQIQLGRKMNGPSGVEWVLTNVAEQEPMQPGPTVVEGLQVSLDADPEKIRFPYANRLILEKI